MLRWFTSPVWMNFPCVCCTAFPHCPPPHHIPSTFPILTPPSLCLVKAHGDLHQGHTQIYIKDTHRFTWRASTQANACIQRCLISISFPCPLWPEGERSFKGWRVFILEECYLQLVEVSQSEVFEWEVKTFLEEAKFSPTEDEVDICSYAESQL